MKMNGDVDIGSHLVQDRVDDESSMANSVGGRDLNLSLFVQKYQVRDLDKAKVHRIRV